MNIYVYKDLEMMAKSTPEISLTGYKIGESKVGGWVVYKGKDEFLFPANSYILAVEGDE